MSEDFWRWLWGQHMNETSSDDKVRWNDFNLGGEEYTPKICIYIYITLKNKPDTQVEFVLYV